MWTSLLIGLGVVALAVLAVGVFSAVRENQPTIVEERLGRYAEAGQSIGLDEEAKERSSPIGDRLNQALQGRGFAGRIAADLAQADVKLTVGEYLAVMAICATGGILIAILITALPDCMGSPLGVFVCLTTRSYADTILLTVIAGLVGLFAPRFYLRFQTGQRITRFGNQLGDTINLLVNALRSGYSILQAMEAAAREQPAPIGPEFRRVVQEMQLGLSMEDALDNLLRRIRSEDLDLMITAVKVQREVGGNLAEILDVISFTIRERIRIKGEIKVLTSQGMATGYALVAMPIILGVILFFVNRPYMMQLFVAENQPCGWAMIIAGLIMLFVGWLIVRKIVMIEI